MTSFAFRLRGIATLLSAVVGMRLLSVTHADAAQLWVYGAQVTRFATDGRTPEFHLETGKVIADDEKLARVLVDGECRKKRSNVLSVNILYVKAPTPPPPPDPKPIPAPEPPKPEGLVARWFVQPGERVASRDNRKAELPRDRCAKIVVHLPADVQSTVNFNLKHDKRHKGRGKSDRGRTGTLRNGDIVRGDAHDWAAFEDRIYIGELNGKDECLKAQPDGFYVDLVLIPDCPTKPEDGTAKPTAKSAKEPNGLQEP